MTRAWLLCALALGCDDPVRDARIAALGEEQPGVPQGPLHRADQPCLLCHDGARARKFSVAGTVHRSPEGQSPAPNVIVELTDALGSRYEVASNCAGNFFVEPHDFAPTYPLWIALRYGDLRVEMDTPVQRDGSCASCHAPTRRADSAGPVYLSSAELTEPAPCP